jgi:hypothetical protein
MPDIILGRGTDLRRRGPEPPPGAECENCAGGGVIDRAQSQTGADAIYVSSSYCKFCGGTGQAPRDVSKLVLCGVALIVAAVLMALCILAALDREYRTDLPPQPPPGWPEARR